MYQKFPSRGHFFVVFASGGLICASILTKRCQNVDKLVIYQRLGEEITAKRVSRKMIAQALIRHVNSKCEECKETLIQI